MEGTSYSLRKPTIARVTYGYSPSSVLQLNWPPRTRMAPARSDVSYSIATRKIREIRTRPNVLSFQYDPVRRPLLAPLPVPQPPLQPHQSHFYDGIVLSNINPQQQQQQQQQQHRTPKACSESPSSTPVARKPYANSSTRQQQTLPASTKYSVGLPARMFQNGKNMGDLRYVVLASTT